MTFHEAREAIREAANEAGHLNASISIGCEFWDRDSGQEHYYECWIGAKKSRRWYAQSLEALVVVVRSALRMELVGVGLA